MSRFLQIMFCGLLLATAGCKTEGPTFNAYTGETTRQDSAMYEALATARDPAFVQLQSTNGLPPEYFQPPADFFRLGPTDIINIEVLGDPGPPTLVTVGPDGKIYYSLLPGMLVWGMTLAEAKEHLESAMNRYLRVRPELALSVRTVGSKKLWVMGTVPRPGVYPLATPMTILEAITTAGGTGGGGGAEDIADLTRSFIMRQGTLLNVDLHRLLRQGDLSQNIYLHPDDLVYLRSSTTREIYVFGAVASPNVLAYSEGMSLMSAISAAGRPLPYATLSNVAIVRGALSRPMIATVDLRAIAKGQARDVSLQPGDIVYVSFSPTRRLELLADQVLTQFVRTMAVNEGANAVIQDAEPVGVVVPLAP